MDGTRIGIVRDEIFLDHDSPVGHHPECSERLTAIWQALDASGVLRDARRFPAREATVEELERAHDPSHVRTALEALGRGYGFFDPDTYFSEGSRAAALGAAGGGLDAALAVWRGELDVALATVRPPGHHATRRRAMGFCIFNNVAVAAAGLLAAGAERVLIFDWDVHHGNGTQAIFAGDPRVLFVSCHLYPHYPGSGASDEVGEGRGKGYTVNVPFPHGAGNAEFMAVFDRLLEPLAAAFRPQMVLVSAGYDGHRDDPLGGLTLDEEGYRAMAYRLRRMAREYAGGKVMLFLEGGYDLRALSASVVATVEGLAADPASPPPFPAGGRLGERAMAALGRTMAALGPYWKGAW